MMKRRVSAATIVAGAAVTLLSTACGGGSSSRSAAAFVPVPVPSSTAAAVAAHDPRATASLTVSAQIDAARLPQMAGRTPAGVVRTTLADARRTMAQIASVEVDGTLFQGSASAQRVTNVQSLPLSNGAVNVSMTFANVVPAANDWVIFEFYAVAPDGSKQDIGTLGSFVTVGSGVTNAGLGTASTQVLQIAAPLLLNGTLSTYDIEQNANLASQLATQIAATGITPNAQTQLYDVAAVETAVAQIAPLYRRDVTVTAANGSGNEQLSVAYDSTQSDENDLASNAISLAKLSALGANAIPIQVAHPLNAPLAAPGVAYYGASTTPAFTTPTTAALHAQPTQVTAYLAAAGNTSTSYTFKNVYGGHLIVSARDPQGNPTPAPSGAPLPTAAPTAPSIPSGGLGQNAQYPFPRSLGGTATAAPAAPGSRTIAVTMIDNTQTAQVTNPALTAFAYGGSFFEVNSVVSFGVAPAANAGGVVPSYRTSCVSGYCADYGLLGPNGASRDSDNRGATVPSGTYYGRAQIDANGTLTYDAWNAFGVPPAQLLLCSVSSCAPGNSANVPVQSAFFDPGTNVAYYGWKGVAPTTVTTPSPGPSPVQSPPGYAITIAVPTLAPAAAPTTNPNPIPFSVTASAPSGAAPLLSNSFRGVANNFSVGLDATALGSSGVAIPLSLTVTDTNGSSYADTSETVSIGSASSLYFYPAVTSGGYNVPSPPMLKTLTLSGVLPAGSITLSSSPTVPIVLKNISSYPYFCNATLGSNC